MPGIHRAAVSVLGALALSAAIAASAAAPDAPAAAAPVVDLPPAVLDRYTGYYRLSETAVITITRAGPQLSAQLTGQPAAEIYPENPASFVYKIVAARIDFVPDPPMEITSLVLHQRGVDHIAQRIDEAEAQRIAAAVATRLQDQSPAPGSEQAVRLLLAGIALGKPNYDQMGPELASATQAQLPQLQSGLKALGAVQSVVFQGVGNQGWDLYLVRHEHGTSQVRILLGANGIINGALITAGP